MGQIHIAHFLSAASGSGWLDWVLVSVRGLKTEMDRVKKNGPKSISAIVTYGLATSISSLEEPFLLHTPHE